MWMSLRRLLPVPVEGPVRVRSPAVAGRFYPADPDQLRALVWRSLAAARPPAPGSPRPRALIVPHAGYVFSAPVAANGYAWLTPWSQAVKRVVLLGTCHTAGVSGLAVSSARAFETPLGRVPVDCRRVDRALKHPEVHVDDAAQDRDHALEVQLPFLQLVLDSFAIVPFLVGQIAPEPLAGLLDELLDDPAGTLIVVSTDLSHGHPEEDARHLDLATAEAIERLDLESIAPRAACGRGAVAGLLLYARRHQLRCLTLDLRSSADTAGPRDHVVGYGAWVFLDREQGGTGGTERTEGVCSRLPPRLS